MNSKGSGRTCPGEAKGVIANHYQNISNPRPRPLSATALYNLLTALRLNV